MAIVMMLSVFMCACGKNESVVGSWNLSQDGVGSEIVFNEDGTGTVSVMGGFFSSEFTYTVEGKNLTVVTNDGNTTMLPFESGKYSIDGDTMTVETDDYIYYLTKK